MIKTKCPASCGELFQGYINGSNKLISYPINLFSHVTLEEGYSTKDKYPKVYKGIEKTFKYFNYDSKKDCGLKINISSDIPRGKGMASSTADLAATILATVKYLGKEIKEEEIATICTEVEPTDSIIFSQLTLFDYIKGDYIKKYKGSLGCRVLCLEGKGVIDTISFHKALSKSDSNGRLEDHKKALEYIEKGLDRQDMISIGKGATLSAFINQKYLYKKKLHSLNSLALKCGAYGLNIAHSGTVIGILYKEKSFDKESFLFQLNKVISFNNYSRIMDYEIISGGPKFIE